MMVPGIEHASDYVPDALNYRPNLSITTGTSSFSPPRLR